MVWVWGFDIILLLFKYPILETNYYYTYLTMFLETILRQNIAPNMLLQTRRTI